MSQYIRQQLELINNRAKSKARNSSRAELIDKTKGLNSQPHDQEEEELTAIDYPVLDRDALHGLAGDTIRIISPHTEADEVAMLIQFLAGFGNIINRSAYFCAGADRHYAKLFLVLVGPTATGRKGSSWSEVKRVLERADATFSNCIQHGLSSGEGLIHLVRDPQYKKTPIKEKNRIVDYQDEMIDGGVEEKRAFIVEPEFARVLKVSQREGNTLSSVIREAWDSDRLRVMTKNATQASNAHVSIVGHVTKEELKKTLAETDTTNGFANRFLWVCVRISKYLPDGGNLGETNLNETTRRLWDAIEFAKNVGEMKRDAAASDFWREIYKPLTHGHVGLVGSVTSRATAQTLRLAMIYALLDCSEVIRLEHLKAGLAVWRYCEDSAKYIFGNSLGNKLAEEILDLMKSTNIGMSRSDISNGLQRNKTSVEIKIALELLLEVGRIESFKEQGSTRSREMFRVKRDEKNEFNEFYPPSSASGP